MDVPGLRGGGAIANGYEDIPPSSWNASAIDGLRDRLRELEKRVAKLEGKKVACEACEGSGFDEMVMDICSECGGKGRQ